MGLERTGRGTLQEFVAGAHCTGKEVVVRLADGERLLIVAVDETRQRCLAELFAASDDRPTDSGRSVTARWRMLHQGGSLAAVRLDLAFACPVRVEVRLLFWAQHSVTLPHAVEARGVCLLSIAGFAALERYGTCSPRAIVIPNPPTGELARALATSSAAPAQHARRTRGWSRQGPSDGRWGP